MLHSAESLNIFSLSIKSKKSTVGYKFGILGGSDTMYNNNAVSGQTDKVVYNNYGLLKISKKFTCKICKPSIFILFVLHVYINDYQNLFYNDSC